MSELYDRFKRVQEIIKKGKIISKKDLLKLKPAQLKEYFTFKAFLKIDKRFKPSTVLREFKKYKKTAIKFKSHDIGLNLTKTTYFDDKDKFRSSKKLSAVVTDAIQASNLKLDGIKEKFESVDIRYNESRIKKVLKLDIDSVDFLEELPESYYINIDGTSYNKNGLDFIFDYFNQSNDYVENLSNKVDRKEIRIYKR